MRAVRAAISQAFFTMGPLSMAGVVLGMATTPVMPPLIAASVPDWIVSAAILPGSRRWTCGSKNAGLRILVPPPSIIRVSGGISCSANPRVSTPRMIPFSIRTSASTGGADSVATRTRRKRRADMAGRNGGEYTAGKDQHPAASKRKGQPSGAGAVR